MSRRGNFESSSLPVSRDMPVPVGCRPGPAVRLTANEQRILEVLDAGPLPRADVEAGTGLTVDIVKRGLQSLREKGLVTLIGQQRSRSARWARIRD